MRLSPSLLQMFVPTDDSTLPASNVRVVLRVRGGQEEQNVFAITEGNNGKDVVQFDQRTFEFDKALGPEATQTELYDAVFNNAPMAALNGYNITMMAYGSTGSGKTYSMSGTETEPGVLPQFIDELFLLMEEREIMDKTYLSVSFYEIYREKVYDLLSSERMPLRVRGTPCNILIDKLTEIGVNSRHEFDRWRRVGLSRRATAATLLNDLSSRSHAIFSIKINHEVCGKNGTKSIREAKCLFVDLAGSEKADVTNQKLKTEAASINKSLIALQCVVDACYQRKSFTNYRDSLLTRLLQHSFAGNSITTLLATVNPDERSHKGSLATLMFSCKAAVIEQAPRSNECHHDSIADLREQNDNYLKEIDRINAQLAELKQYAAIVNKLEAPCLVELFEDDSMNRWLPLTDGIEVDLIRKTKILKFSIQKGMSWTLKALTADVAINGKVISTEKWYRVSHGDRISYKCWKFCTLYLDSTMVPKSLPTYDKAKLEMVQATHEIEKQSLIAQMKEDFKAGETEIKSEMAREITELKKQVIELRSKESFASSKDKALLRCRRESIEKAILDTEELQRNLKLAISDECKRFDDRDCVKFDDAAHDERSRLAGDIQFINDFFDKVNKTHFIFRIHQTMQGCTVRLFNKKEKMFAELSVEKFGEIKNCIGNIYQSALPLEDVMKEVDSIVYSNTLNWSSARPAQNSSILKQAITNSLLETARKRRSTVAELNRGFQSRRSIIADVMLKKTDLIPETPVEEVCRQFAFYMSQPVDMPKFNECETMLNTLLLAIDVARSRSEAFSLPETFCDARNVQKAVCSAIGVIRATEAIRYVGFCCNMMKCDEQIVKYNMEYLFVEMLDRTDAICRLIDSWTDASIQGQDRRDVARIINDHLDYIVRACGRYAFGVGIESCGQKSLEATFHEGILNGLDEFVSDIDESIARYSNCERSLNRMRAITCAIVKNLLGYVNRDNPDFKFIFKIMRAAIFIREHVLVLTEDRAGSIMDKIRKLCDNVQQYDCIPPKVVESLYDAAKEFDQLCFKSQKPPMPMRK